LAGHLEHKAQPAPKNGGHSNVVTRNGFESTNLIINNLYINNGRGGIHPKAAIGKKLKHFVKQGPHGLPVW
jgi:hypothetical protein